MKRLGVLITVLALFACQFEQDELAGEGKNLVGIHDDHDAVVDKSSGKKYDIKKEEPVSCSQYFRNITIKETHTKAKEDLSRHGLPVPNDFNVFLTVDDVINPDDVINKNVIVSKKAENLFSDCIECRLICMVNAMGNRICKMALKLKGSDFSFTSDNPSDSIVVYGEGEHTEKIAEGQLAGLKFETPFICSFGHSNGGTGNKSEKSCIPIDSKQCKEHAVIDYETP